MNNNTLSAKEQLKELAIAEAFSDQVGTDDNVLTEKSSEITNNRVDGLGDAFSPGDIVRFALVYSQKTEGDTSELVAEIIRVTPRSVDKLINEYVYGGLAGKLPRFYEEGLHEPEAVLAGFDNSRAS